jgi:hypothetical protein
MIQAITKTNMTTFIQTEDNRIDTTVDSSKVRHLVKFINDLDKSVQYAYSTVHDIKDRYTKFVFDYNATPDVYTGRVNFLPSGSWKYEIYEVVWTGAVAISAGNAPVTEDDVLPVAPTHGIVKGLVTKGKMNVSEKSGTEQVKYTQHTEPSGTNYIWYGQ